MLCRRSTGLASKAARPFPTADPESRMVVIHAMDRAQAAARADSRARAEAPARLEVREREEAPVLTQALAPAGRTTGAEQVPAREVASSAAVAPPVLATRDARGRPATPSAAPRAEATAPAVVRASVARAIASISARSSPSRS